MSIRQRTILVGLIAIVALGIILGWSSMFTVDERELAVVMQFGNPVTAYDTPGLRFKIPFIQTVRRLPKTYQLWIGTGNEILEKVPTADGKRIEVTPWAIWRITDPLAFVEVMRTVEQAQFRVKTFVRGEVRDQITANKLSEVVRNTGRPLTYPLLAELLKVLKEGAKETRSERTTETDRQPDSSVGPVPGDGAAVDEEETFEEWLATQKSGREQIRVGRKRIVEEITRLVQQRLAKSDGEKRIDRGIELVDMGISRIDFIAKVREAAFQRQIAFWEWIASAFTNQGEKMKQQILNRTDAQVQEMLGEGKREATTLRGDADAAIIRDYAEVINETGEFYNFIRTLEAYKLALGKNTRLILTTNSELLRLLKENPTPPASTTTEGR